MMTAVSVPRAWLQKIVFAFVLMVLLFPCPAQAQAIREIEPNDRETEAMTVSPGTVVDGSWSYSRSKETRRGTDRDNYRLANFTYPGTTTFTVTPSAGECKYWFGVTNFRGPFSGPVTLTFTVEEQNRVTIRFTGGGQPDYQYVVYDKDPLNDRLLTLEPTFFNSDKDGGFQCVKDGRIYQNIPYQLTISGAAAQMKPEPPPPSRGGACRAEVEPNDRENEAMALSPPSCVEAGWSYARSKETRRGTDRDNYRLTNFTYPGTATFTVTPSISECKYWFGVMNFRGPFSGPVTLTYRVEEQNRVTIRFTGGGQPDYQYVVYDKDPLNDKLLTLEPTFWNSDRDGGFQCVKDGRIYQNIAYRLDVSTAGGSVTAPVQPPPKTGRNLGETEAPLRQPAAQITLAPGASWEGEFPADPTFTLNARIDWKQVAGAASLLEVRINGQPLTGGLANKSGSFRLADGREFPYYADSVRAWTIFYSPDFAANNSAAGGVYEVVTNPGQAYRYQWNTGLIGGPPLKVSLKHNGLVNAPLIIQFAP